MKAKKIMGLVLAGAMALTMAAPAFADALTGQSGSVTVKGATQEPTISITLPTMATSGSDVIINPYGLSVSIGGSSVNDTIATVAKQIVNRSNVSLKISVTPTATIAKGITLATGPKVTVNKQQAPVSEATTKTIFLWVGFKTADDETATAPTFTEFKEGGTGLPADEKQVVVAAKGTKTDLFTLDATDGTSGNGNSLWFKFAGDVAKAPDTAWADTDTVDTTLAFSFVPQFTGAQTAPSITSASANGTAVTIVYDLGSGAPAATAVTGLKIGSTDFTKKDSGTPAADEFVVDAANKTITATLSSAASGGEAVEVKFDDTTTKSSTLSLNAAPSVTAATSADGQTGDITISLGSGTLAATGVTSVKIGPTILAVGTAGSLSDNQYSITGTTISWKLQTAATDGVTVEVVFNDTATTTDNSTTLTVS